MMTTHGAGNHLTIDAYLAALAARLTVEPIERATILEEIRSHLEAAASAEAAHGATLAEAESRAVANFGSAAATARSLNAALPVYWDMRRMLRGVALGALAIWVVWTLATFPFVVQMAAEPQFDGITSPAALLFSASPLGFGLFYTLLSGPWAALLILALFGAIAFTLGSHASSGWRAGLAFGLGVIVGMPFVPLSLLPLSQHFIVWTLLPVIFAIWLLVPYAVLAAWCGARIARIREGRRMRVTPITPITAPRAPRISRAALAGLVTLVALLGVNGWSFARARTPAPVVVGPTAAQQLANAQAMLPFAIRLPGYVPDGMTLRFVAAGVSDCNPCGPDDYDTAILEYSDSHDGWIRIMEQQHPLPVASATPDYSYNVVSATGYRQVWWLGVEEKTEQAISLTWNDGALEYDMSTNIQGPRPLLERIAASLSR